jgi:hypothetical protein
MHNESMMVAGALALIGFVIAGFGAKKVGMVFVGLAGLMVVAGLSG